MVIYENNLFLSFSFKWVLYLNYTKLVLKTDITHVFSIGNANCNPYTVFPCKNNQMEWNEYRNENKIPHKYSKQKLSFLSTVAKNNMIFNIQAPFLSRSLFYLCENINHKYCIEINILIDYNLLMIKLWKCQTVFMRKILNSFPLSKNIWIVSLTPSESPWNSFFRTFIACGEEKYNKKVFFNKKLMKEYNISVQTEGKAKNLLSYIEM